MVINATKFVADILNETPLGTPIIQFTAKINNVYFNNPQSVQLSIVRNDLVETTFNWETGGKDETIIYGDSNPATTPTITIERAIIFAQNLDSAQVPSTLDFDIEVLVVARLGTGVNPLFERQTAVAEITITGESFTLWDS